MERTSWRCNGRLRWPPFDVFLAILLFDREASKKLGHVEACGRNFTFFSIQIMYFDYVQVWHSQWSSTVHRPMYSYGKLTMSKEDGNSDFWDKVRNQYCDCDVYTNVFLLNIFLNKINQ